MAMIPRILTLDHIDTVIRRLPAWRGKSRVRVLKACAHRIKVLLMAKKITAEQAANYRTKVLPRLKSAQRRQRVAEQKQADATAEIEAAELARLAEIETAELAKQQEMWEYLQEWLQEARTSELRDMGARLPRL